MLPPCLLPVLDYFILAGCDSGKVKDRSVYTPYDKRTVPHTAGDKDHAASRQDMLLVFQPELHFCTQVIWVIGVTTEEPDDLSTELICEPVSP